MTKRQFSDVNSTRGAPMGRVEWKGDYEHPYKLRLFQVKMVDGYDDGGAYWGSGFGLDPLYCALCESIAFVDVRMFLRAANREAAKTEVIKTYYHATFYR